MNTDTLIVGSGIAGLSLAIKLAQLEPENRIVVICKTDKMESNTAYAQGGVAAVIDKSDSFEKHINDTLEAGHFLNDKKVVELVVKSAPARLSELIEWGAKFDFKSSGKLDLGMEGGHSAHRIVHHKDSSGKEIHRTLMQKASEFPNVKIVEHLFVIDLLKSETGECCGAKALDNSTKEIVSIVAQQTVLASGGIGQVFKHTTNPLPSTGDGIAIAHRAGVAISDMQYVQFHPTALKGNDNPAFLISEAVRGFGAYLLNEKGERFMSKYDSRLELATRDVVSAAIAKEMEASKSNNIFIDCRHLDQVELKNSFPSIYKKCISVGKNPAQDLIPVTPAAHYLCGGITVNISGKTSLKNLYACGECARTGLHGSNRLASNSLLEALVFADIIAKEIASIPLYKKNDSNIKIALNKQSSYIFDNSQIADLKGLMSANVGVQKNKKSLSNAQIRIGNLVVLENQNPIRKNLTLQNYEAQNLFVLAKLIVEDSLKG